MSKRSSGSFRGRLFAGFLAVSLIPLLVCSATLLQVFRLRLDGDAQRQAQEQSATVLSALDELFDGVDSAAVQLQGSPVIARAMTGGDVSYTRVYNELYAATGQARAYARFDLYDLEGNWRYSTQQVRGDESLSTGWGVLYAAAHAGEGIPFVACEDVTDMQAPRLQGAALLHDRAGGAVGYLLVSVYQDGFQRLLEGKYGTRNDAVLLSAYWRPVYCAQPSTAAALAPRLRARLLSGESLDGLSEDFAYTVASHDRSGLFLVLQRPLVFTRETTSLAYTISAGLALVCVAVSLLLSFALSRQLSLPVQRLTQAVGAVGRNDLEVRVDPAGSGELGMLAAGFNQMVDDLKRNQQELVRNQRELNEAQIRMLQAQLNPHFLCNTLDTMKWISKINQVPQVALMSTDLADILRFCISPDEFVALDREVEVLRRYIEIQQIRLSGALDFSVDVPPELESCLIPKMILQPIVENAILHGLDGVERGSIAVRARMEDGMLHISVADNGRGFPPELDGAHYSRERERRQGHLGLYNVDTILTKYYGEGCGLYLQSGENGGAVVTAVLPGRREEELC